MREQINLQVSFNPKNRSHIEILNWLNEQTTNRSSFIRETILMRMMGMFGVRNIERSEIPSMNDIDQDEVMRLIEV